MLIMLNITLSDRVEVNHVEKGLLFLCVVHLVTSYSWEVFFLFIAVCFYVWGN